MRVVLDLKRRAFSLCIAIKASRFVLLTYGTRGDVEPFVALGLGLVSCGHTVQLVAPGAYEPLARAYGLSFSPLPGDIDQLALTLTDRAGLSWPRMIVRMIQHVLPIAAAVYRSIERETGDADVIVHSFMMADGGHTLATRRGIPDFSAQFFPVFTPTSAFPGVVFPDLPLGGLYRKFTHDLNSFTFRVGGRILYRQVRAAHPGLPDLAPWPFTPGVQPVTPVLYAYSPHVLPGPADWPIHTCVTGYWRLSSPPGWAPPASLLRFLEAGPPPIYFGIGSMRTQRMHELLQDVSRGDPLPRREGRPGRTGRGDRWVD